jgi:hypothetical protein
MGSRIPKPNREPNLLAPLLERFIMR